MRDMIDLDCYIVGLSRFTISPDFTVWGFFMSLLSECLYWFFKVLCSYKNDCIPLSCICQELFLNSFQKFLCGFHRTCILPLYCIVTFCQSYFRYFFRNNNKVVVIGLPYNCKTVRYILNIKLFEIQTILPFENHYHLIISITTPIISFLQFQLKNYPLFNTIRHSF